MRLWILSDLHLEGFSIDIIAVPDADVAVVAGDVDKPIWKAIQWLDEKIAPHMPVIYVPGNHEYYGGSYEGSTKRGLSAAAASQGVHMLHDSEVRIGDVRFVGGTLWTDYALGAESRPGRQRDLDIAHSMNACGSMLRDHTAILLDDGALERFQPEHARAAHKRTRSYLEAVLADGFPGPTVVVTHHAPHPGSIDRQFYGSVLNAAFSTDLSELIRDTRPAMWVHGHMHASAQYVVEETLIVCNPRGYGTENPAFNPGLVVPVPRR
ncbi:metallophosphoesterase [Microvirga sp. P5_D2]